MSIISRLEAHVFAGIYDFEGQINPAKTFTAHPKVDAVTGETMAYAMEASGMA